LAGQFACGCSCRLIAERSFLPNPKQNIPIQFNTHQAIALPNPKGFTPLEF
jgi:hypothetical protein